MQARIDGSLIAIELLLLPLTFLVIGIAAAPIELVAFVSAQLVARRRSHRSDQGIMVHLL